MNATCTKCGLTALFVGLCRTHYREWRKRRAWLAQLGVLESRAMAKTIKGKRAGFGLDMKTFASKDGKRTYIVFRLPQGAFHAFVETEAKQAAKDCGADLKGNPHTREWWESIWDKDARQ